MLRSASTSVLVLLLCFGLSACSGSQTPNSTTPTTNNTGTTVNGQSTTNTSTSTGATGTSVSTNTSASANLDPSKISTPETKGPDVPPCSLVTRTEAESYMGTFEKEPQSLPPQTNEIACLYGPNSSGASATVRVYGMGQWLLQRTIFGEAVIPYELADSAYYVVKDSNTDLWARQGNWVVNVKGSIGIITASQFVEAAFKKL